MLKHFVLFSLAIPLYCHCQSFADTSLYKVLPSVPWTARVEGWEPGSTKANGVLIDLFESRLSPSPDFDQIRGWSVRSWADKDNPAHAFHYILQYDRLNVAFGYDLLVEPIKSTDEIRCTFRVLTDPEVDWQRNKEMPLVALPPDVAPVVIKSGDVLSFTTLPLGEGKIAVVHYIRLTRIDQTPDSGPNSP